MPDKNAHIKRAESNFSFLNLIKNSDYSDWKVTVAFYTALHIINAYIFDKTGNHYRTHKMVEKVTNPNNPMSICKLDETTYAVYQSLSGLSKRSRYMVHEKSANKTNDERLIYDKHVAKSYRHLNHILEHFPEYSKNIKGIEINLIEINQGELKYFTKPN